MKTRKLVANSDLVVHRIDCDAEECGMHAQVINEGQRIEWTHGWVSLDVTDKSYDYCVLCYIKLERYPL